MKSHTHTHTVWNWRNFSVHYVS